MSGPARELSARLNAAKAEVDVSLHFCATCIQESFRDWHALKPFLHDRVCDIAEQRDERPAFAALGSGCMKTGRLLAGHRMAEVQASYRYGPKGDPAVRAALVSISPNLVAPTARYDARRPLDPAILAELQTPRLAEVIGFGYWTEPRYDPRTFQPYAGERFQGRTPPPLESLASLSFRVPFKVWHPRGGKIDACVVSEHGMARLNAMLAVAGTRTLSIVEQDEFAAHGTRERVADRMAWHLLDMYLAMRGEDELLRRLDALWPRDVPRFPRGLAELVPDAAERDRVAGDIAVLFHRVEEVRALGNPMLPVTRTYAQLFEELEARRYPRLARSTDTSDLRQRYFVMYGAIAAEMEWVRIATVDWRPLRRAAGFETRGKKRAT